MNPFAYARATSTQDASKKAKQGALLKAGGIDLLGRMKRGTLHPDLLVDLSFLEKMDGIKDLGEQGCRQKAFSASAGPATMRPAKVALSASRPRITGPVRA